MSDETIVQVNAAYLQSIVKKGIEEGLKEAKTAFYIEAEHHYKSHERLDKLIKIYDESTGIMWKVIIGAIALFLLGCFVIGFVQKLLPGGKMEPITMALGLAQYVPKLVGWIAGDKGEEVAGKVLDVAMSVTNGATPYDAVDMITDNPEMQIKFRELAGELELGLEREHTQQLAIVNTTMQTESKSEHWPQYSWRPFWGFTSGIAFLTVCILICTLAYKAVMEGSADAMAMIPQIITTFTTLFAIPGAILGISAWGRNKMKVAQVK